MYAAAASNGSRWALRSSFIGIIVLLCCFRLAHVHLLWADEDYHLAAAIQILHGKIPYRDFWYDKPPFDALYYLLIRGNYGWPLRVLDAVYALIACWLCYRIALVWWSRAEAAAAAVLFAFFTTFYLPATVIPFAADALMVVPHVAAIYFAVRKAPFWAGVFCGIAFLTNAKALFVLLVCAAWFWPDWLFLGIGFAIPATTGALVLWGWGALPSYIEQVWRWGVIYSKDSPIANPVALGAAHSANWLGFHIALALAVIFGFLHFSRTERWRFAVWLAFSFLAICVGTRFVSRYYLQVLPAMVIAGSRGMVLAFQTCKRVVMPVVIGCLLVPFIRFGPRYLMLAGDDLAGRPPNWVDVNLDLDSQDVSHLLKNMAEPGDTLFVWGYRPDIYVYTRLIPPSLFWDSQPLTGVPADRHLSQSTPIYNGPAAANRQELTGSHPTWIVDGLGLLNPKLRPDVYPELRTWLSRYRLTARTRLSLIYRAQ